MTFLLIFRFKNRVFWCTSHFSRRRPTPLQRHTTSNDCLCSLVFSVHLGVSYTTTIMVLTRSTSKAKRSSPTHSASPTSPASSGEHNRSVTTIDKEIDAIFKDLQKALKEQSELGSTEEVAIQVYDDRIARYHHKLLSLVQERLQTLDVDSGGHVDTPLPSSSLQCSPRSLAVIDADIASVYKVLKTSKTAQRRKSRGSVDSQVLGESLVYTQQQLCTTINERIQAQKARLQENEHGRVSSVQDGTAAAPAAGTSGVVTGGSSSNIRNADLSNGFAGITFAGAPTTTPVNTPATARPSFSMGTSPSTTAGSFREHSSSRRKQQSTAAVTSEFGEQTTQSGHGLFGSNTPANPSDGWTFRPAPAPTGSRLFGGSPAPAPAPSSGLFGAPVQTGGLFGSSPNTAPSSTSGGLFGAPPVAAGGGLFGSSPSPASAPASAAAPQPSSGFTFKSFGSGGASLFGSTGPAPPAPTNVPFQPTVALDGGKSGITFQSITAMPEYRDMSFEELRLQDYQEANRHPYSFSK
jgi:hypothetical protein